MPSLKDILFGTKDKVKKQTLLSPEQDQLMKLISEGLTKGTGSFGDLFGNFNQESFDKGVTEPALKNFKENILPMLQERFVAGNQVGGSGMMNAQNKAAVDLQSQLAQLMYQAQNQQKQNQFGGIQQGLGTRGFENVYKQGNQGLLQGLLQGASPDLGKLSGLSIAG